MTPPIHHSDNSHEARTLAAVELAHEQTFMEEMNADAQSDAVTPVAPALIPETEVSGFFEENFGAKFELFPQVWLRHADGRRIRIDYIGVERSGAVEGPIGFEMKRGGLKGTEFTDFSNALAQCIDYSQSTIETTIDGRKWYGRHPKFVFMFPCPYRIYEYRRPTSSDPPPPMRDLWAQGEMKLAAKYGVGGAYFDEEVKRDWGLFLAGHPAWWLRSGATDLMTRHAVGSRKGSAR